MRATTQSGSARADEMRDEGVLRDFLGETPLTVDGKRRPEGYGIRQLVEGPEVSQVEATRPASPNRHHLSDHGRAHDYQTTETLVEVAKADTAGFVAFGQDMLKPSSIIDGREVGDPTAR